MKEYGFTDLVEVEKLQALMDLSYKCTGVPVLILDVNGNVLVGSGRQEICLKYHKVNKITSGYCQENLSYLSEHLFNSDYTLSKCKNGLSDMAVPIMKDGRHLAILSLGQFFFDDEEVDREYFRKQAIEYGFNVEEYMAALDRVPVFSREHMDHTLEYYCNLVDSLIDQGIYRQQLSREVEEKKNAEKSIVANYKFLDALIDSIPNPVFYKDNDGTFLECNTAFAQQILGVTKEKLIGKKLEDFPQYVTRERLDFYKQKDAELLGGTGIQEYENNVKCPDGVAREFFFSKALLRDDNGNANGIVGVMIDLSERKLIEKALRESQECLEQISDSALDAILMMDNLGRISFWNNAAEKMFGYSESEIMGRNLHLILAPKRFHEKHLEAFREFVLTGQGMAIGKVLELAAIRKDGTEFPIELSVSRIDKDGEFHAVGIVRDITERKRTENVLKDTLEELEAVVENSLIGIIVMANRIMTKVNKRAAEIFGCSAEELLGKSTRIIHVSEEQYKEFGNICYSRLMKEDGIHIEYPFKRKDGKQILLKLNGKSLVPFDISKGVVWAVDDITEQKRMEEALKKSEQRFRDITYAAGQYIWECDDKGIFTYLSDRVKTIYGFNPEEMLGKSGFEFLPEGEYERMTVWFTNLIETSSSFKDFEHRFIDVNGKEHWQRISGEPMVDDDGNFCGYRGSGIDITEQKIAEEEKKKMEAQIQHSQKMESLGVLAGGIAHDFNNLLMRIVGNADLAHMNLAPGSPAGENIDAIIESANRAAELSRQLLAYSGHGKFLIETTDINQVINDLKNLFDITKSMNTQINYKLSGGLPPIKADVSQVQQILLNLITNASEAIGENKGIIKLTTGSFESMNTSYDFFGQLIPPGTYVFLEVADSGCGIDEESMKSIFDPFYTTKFTGRGLGLAAVHGIVRGHHGAIQLRSRPGTGTTLKILLPAME